MIDKIETNIEILDINEEDHYGKFALYPLERGYGTTIGNSMRGCSYHPYLVLASQKY